MDFHIISLYVFCDNKIENFFKPSCKKFSCIFVKKKVNPGIYKKPRFCFVVAKIKGFEMELDYWQTWRDQKISQIQNRRVCLIEFKRQTTTRHSSSGKWIVEDYVLDDMFCQVRSNTQNRFPVTEAEYCPTWPAAGPAAWQEDPFACHLVKM